MLFGLQVFIYNLKPYQFVILTILAGILSLLGIHYTDLSDDPNLIMINVIWQAGMLLALSVIIKSKK